MTIVAAWISAETGVGPSIASGSQTCSGNWALLPTAPAKSSSATIQIGIGRCAREHRGRARPGCSIESRMFEACRVSTKIAMIPSAKPTSPTRLVMNAFLLASAAVRLRYQKPMSR